MVDFVHLHLHTHYSLKASTIVPGLLFDRLARQGSKAVAVTDFQRFCGTQEFYAQGVRRGIKPILGVELSFLGEGVGHEHMVLLAKNETGWRNLLRLMAGSSAWLDWQGRAMYLADLARYRGGIIALCASEQGPVASSYFSGTVQSAAETACRFRDILEPGCFYLELQDGQSPRQQEVNGMLIDVGRSQGIPLVATACCHLLYGEGGEVERYRNLRQMKELKALGRRQDTYPSYGDCYVKSPYEMAHAFAHVPDAIENTLCIAEQCNVQLFSNRVREERGEPPRFFFPPIEALDEGGTHALLCRLVHEGFEHRCAEGLVPEDRIVQYEERLEAELAATEAGALSAYLVGAKKLVDRLRDKGIRVGGMEREAQCSLMLYALDLTETDPVAFGLPHGFFFRYGEGGVQPFRFRLGENDLCGLEECVMEVFEGSGLARVASEACAPGEFIELATKVFHLDDSMVEVLKKELAGRKLCDLRLRREEVLSEDEEVLLHEISVLHENWSCDRQSFGTYAVYDRSSCADLPLLPNQDPLGNGSALPLTQYDPGQLLDAGVMYYSFERCRLTDHIFNTLFELQDVLGWGKPERRPRWEYGVNDVSVYKRLSAGRLPEIGWLREPLLRQTLQEVRPESIGDLADVIALCFFKNACLGIDEEYMACRKGDEDAPRLPILAVESLRSPRCALIYREQVVEILCGSVGLSAARAVEFVNSAFHAKRERLAAFGDVILSACRERGISPAEAIELNQYLRRHGTFLFSRAHAVSCALLIYQITYLGVHVPATLAGVLALWMESQEDEEEDSPIFP